MLQSAHTWITFFNRNVTPQGQAAKQMTCPWSQREWSAESSHKGEKKSEQTVTWTGKHTHTRERCTAIQSTGIASSTTEMLWVNGKSLFPKTQVLKPVPNGVNGWRPGSSFWAPFFYCLLLSEFAKVHWSPFEELMDRQVLTAPFKAPSQSGDGAAGNTKPLIRTSGLPFSQWWAEIEGQASVYSAY